MSVRKRKWKTGGTEHNAWVVDYADAQGKRRLKTFARKKDADEFEKRAGVEVMDGVHVADAASITVIEAGKLWMTSGENAGLERGTMEQRRQHLELHIKPFIGDVKLNKATVPWVREFQDRLRQAGRSADMVKRVTVSLGSIIADAQSRGLAARNPVHEKSRARSGTKASEKRQKARLKVGVDIPSPDEIKAFLPHLTGRWRPLLMTATFTGMRSSELRGLPWSDVDLDKKQIHVRQRADLFNEIGRPKSSAGERTIPLPPLLVNTLREWKLACPRRNTDQRDENGEAVKVLDLVFPTGDGNVENRSNIAKRGLIPAMIAAGLTADTGKRDEDGKAILTAKYPGLHSLRHFYASWLINPVSAGGHGLLPKAVQERMGHASIAITMDTYGHLFPTNDDGSILAAAERSLLS